MQTEQNVKPLSSEWCAHSNRGFLRGSYLQSKVIWGPESHPTDHTGQLGSTTVLRRELRSAELLSALGRKRKGITRKSQRGHQEKKEGPWGEALRCLNWDKSYPMVLKLSSEDQVPA